MLKIFFEKMLQKNLTFSGRLSLNELNSNFPHLVIQLYDNV